jgi:para-nitrobenzyl esterase
MYRTEVLDCRAKKLFQVCPQINLNGTNIQYGKEDCLYLNVYVPTEHIENATTTFPIFFWIYGGGFVFGDKNELGFYDGKNLATSRNVVVVEPNYRLGVLGFLALNALVEESDGTAGNYGTVPVFHHGGLPR